jgi:hypothetical protein
MRRQWSREITEILCDWCEQESWGPNERVRKFADGTEMHSGCHKEMLDKARVSSSVTDEEWASIEEARAARRKAELACDRVIRNIARAHNVSEHTLMDVMWDRKEEAEKAKRAARKKTRKAA